MDISKTESLAVLKPRKALPFFSRHPWIFEGAIARIEGDPAPGDVIVVRSHEGQFVARGLWNPNSRIRTRLYSWEESQPLDFDFWKRQIQQACALRQELFPNWTSQSAGRWIASEGDFLSGLTVDRYGDWLVTQFTSLALFLRRAEIIEILQELLSPRGVILRTERSLREAEGIEAADGLLAGEQPGIPFVLSENGLEFETDLSEGQKTGYFLDQRDNRMRAAAFANDRRVLDICSYTGGFALHCLKHGSAREVVAVDSSASALELAARNAQRNGLADRVQFIKGDAFDVLDQQNRDGERYGLVILDPPKLARKRGGLDAAHRAYLQLNRTALQLIEPGGYLVTCSCSGLVSQDDFLAIIAKAAIQSRRTFQILEVRGPAADHPRSIHCLESEYLKCCIGRVG